MSADLVGTVVGGKYQVRSKIGTGSMGDVYEAMNGSQAVALKVLKVDDETITARFLREAKTMSLFAHPNIVELLEVGKLDDGRLFFAAELVRGETLRKMLEWGPLDAKRSLQIVRQVLAALGHAHAMGVVHRDIKPENVMIATDGTVKILDFGVAKLIGDTPAVLGEGTLTITGYGALGTPYYISPEAVLGRPLDARADIYSIGAMLFEMLTGKPPYMHDDVAVLMRMHAAAPIPPVPDATPGLALVVSEALAKKPDLRFKSAAEMIDAVDAAARSLEEPKKSTDVFGALPLKPPGQPDISAGQPASFSPSSIPSASQPIVEPPKRTTRGPLPGVAPYETPAAGTPAITQTPHAGSQVAGTQTPHAGSQVAGTQMPHAGAQVAGGPPFASAPGIATASTERAPHPVSTPPYGAPMGVNVPSHNGGPVMGVVVPVQGPSYDQHGAQPSAPMFAPPMPSHVVVPKGSSPLIGKLSLLAQKHRKWLLIGMGAFVVIIIVAIAVAKSGGKKSTSSTTTAEKKPGEKPEKRADLARGAQELIAAGHPSKAAALLEAEEIGDDADTLLVLGHARIGSNRRLDGLGAYERAIEVDKKLAADPTMRANVQRVLETKDAVAGVVALELAMRLDPPAKDLVKQLAGNGKVSDVRRRAMAIAEREKFSDGIDKVESWSLDLAQASTCDDRLAAILKLRRSADPRAIPALKRAKTYRCVEREVAEAIAYLESRPATPSSANP